jgi:hypothetical protein
MRKCQKCRLGCSGLNFSWAGIKSSSTQSAKQEWAAASDTRRQGNYKNGKIEFYKKFKSQIGTKISVKRGAKIKKMIMHQLKRYWIKIIKLAWSNIRAEVPWNEGWPRRIQNTLNPGQGKRRRSIHRGRWSFALRHTSQS